MSVTGHKTSPEQLLEQCQKVMQATKSNRSSMLEDFQYKRKNEIDYMNGYFIKTANKHNIATPYNHQIYEKIALIWKNSAINQ